MDIYQDTQDVLYKDKTTDILDYIPNIKENGNFSGELELEDSSIIFKINIAVYIPDNTNKKYNFYNYYYIPKTEHNNYLLILVYEQHAKHYYQLISNYKIIKTNNIN